jgi:uridine kinase
MSLGEEIEVLPKNLIVIEGVYSMHPDFGKYYDLAVFLDISPIIQKERILNRNSSLFAKRFFEEWIPLENEYFTKTNIKKRCDLIIEVF